jgi:DMSO/TMAO reductase YedYZ molybdopterin-dependent catalytic subunit
MIEETPYNAETPLDALRIDVTPAASFYFGNHFTTPTIKAGNWRLRVTGAVKREEALSLPDIRAMRPRKTPLVTL